MKDVPNAKIYLKRCAPYVEPELLLAFGLLDDVKRYILKRRKYLILLSGRYTDKHSYWRVLVWLAKRSTHIFTYFVS